MSLTPHIRWCIRRDMPEILAIESMSFDDPWTEEKFLARFREPNCIPMVAEHTSLTKDRYLVIGFMVYELHKTSINVIDFAVHPQYRRQGVGSQMMAKLVSKLSSHRRTTLTLQVRETNLDAQLFFRRIGFLATEVVREAYPNGEDAIKFEYAYNSSAVECWGKR